MASALALPEVLAGLVAALGADATLLAMLAVAPTGTGINGRGIYNEVPQGATRPYLVVGFGTEVPHNTMGASTAAKWGGNCTVQLDAVSAQPSDLEALRIIGRAKTVLETGPITVTGFPSVSCAMENLQPTFKEDVQGAPYGLRHAPMIVRVYAHQGQP